MEELAKRFGSWRLSLGAIELTKLNAYDVVGAGPESLLDVAGGWLRDDVPDALENTDVAHECFYPATSIAAQYSPELANFREHHLGSLLRTRYQGYGCPPSTSTLQRAVQAEDAAWVTRLQCLFLPVAAIAHEGETYVFASWHPTSKGTSRTYAVHQDEPIGWAPFPSIAAYVAWSVASSDATGLDKTERTKIKEAIHTQLKLPTETFPAHLDPDTLEPRTRWIVDLFLARAFDPELTHVPTLATWETEKALVPAWPHLQAYWLLYHLLFNNKAEAKWIRERMDKEHPAVAELEQIALAGDDGQVPNFFPTARIAGLRRSVVRRGIDAMGAEARLEIQAELEAVAKQQALMEAWLAKMQASDDAGVQHLVHTWNMLQGAAGALPTLERQLAGVIYAEDPRIAESFTTRHYCGESSIFLEVFDDLCRLVTSAWEPFFEAAYLRAARVSEEDEEGAPGALVGWGIALGSFGALDDKVEALPWNGGRRRLAELAVVADHFIDEPRAHAFLVSEATDFVEEFGAWEHSTMSYALFALLKRDRPEGATLLQQAFEAGDFSGANWQAAMALVEVCAGKKRAELAPALRAAVDHGLGRHDDGDRARVLRAYAACAGEAAKDVLREMQGSIEDVRKTCEEACIVAARLDLEPQDEGLRDRAIALIKLLLDGNGEMELGSAYSLLRSAHDNGVTGCSTLAKRASESKHLKGHLQAWLKQHAASFA